MGRDPMKILDIIRALEDTLEMMYDVVDDMKLEIDDPMRAEILMIDYENLYDDAKELLRNLRMSLPEESQK